MEPQDAEVGFWIRDALYLFRYGDTIEQARRLYFIETKEQEKLSRCTGWASRYFGAVDQSLINIRPNGEGMQFAEDDIVYRNGRPFYFWEKYPTDRKFEIEKPISRSSRSELCGIIAPYNDRDYDMSALICSQLSAGPGVGTQDRGWNKLLDTMSRCAPTSDCDPCTKVGYKIAKSLIRIAALRIFADPEQSIMELPVNSLDAYNPDRKIGKFGMGFFSILYWLVGHSGRKMVIHSFSKDREGKWCSYQVTIREIAGVLSFNLHVYPGSEVTTTGFRVLIECPDDDHFSVNNVEGFKKQLDKLTFASGAKIIYGSSLELRTTSEQGNMFSNGPIPILNKDSTSTNEIVCYVCSSFILVEDYATGVPLEVLLGSLFVPSISTKTIQLSEQTIVAYENKSGWRPGVNGTPNKLVILVGGIAVVSIDSEGVADKKWGDSYIIHMPYNTKLPVSRDDIILTPESTIIFKEGIAKVFDDLVKIEGANVSAFQETLEKYKEFTPSQENRDAVADALHVFFEARKAFLVPNAHHDLYRSISKKFIASATYDSLAVEKWLDDNQKPLTNIWYGVKVLMTTYLGAEVTNGGLINYLFVPESYSRKAGWIPSITTSYFQTKLYPVTSSYGEKEYAKYDKIDLIRNIFTIKHNSIEEFDRVVSPQVKALLKKTPTGPIYPSQVIVEKELCRYFFAVLTKFESLSIYFDIEMNLEQFAASITSCYLFLTKASFLSILGELMRKFSSFSGNQTYGARKNTLKGLRGSLSSEYFTIYFRPPRLQSLEKMESLLTDNIIYSIRAVKEMPTTFLGIGSENSPLNLQGDTSFGKEALFQSSNLVELTILMAGSGKAFTVHDNNISRELIAGFVAYNLNIIRSRKYSALDLVDMYEVWNNLAFDQSNLTKIYLVKSRKLAREWIKNIQNTSDIKTTIAPSIKGGVVVTLGNLITTLFQKDIPPAPKLLSFMKEVSQEPQKSPLQIIEIAVNEGTVKPFIEATMTELVQNSIDAVREFNPIDRNIEIELYKVSRSDGASFLRLLITDYVGMSSDAFVYVGIPFLSTKTPSELVTGEMGSGFFNSYRESSNVTITSYHSGVERISYDEPVRDDRNRVIDIKKTISIKPTQHPNQTTISVTVGCSSRVDEVSKISRVDYTAKNILGLALGPVIIYNGTPVSIPKIMAAKVGYFELYYTDPDTTFKHESYLLTKGVPFSPLAPYFKTYLSQRALDAIDHNFIVNITHGGYTPVQTRTRINIPPEVASDFKRVATYAVFITMLREIFKGHRDYALDHLKSTSDAKQLYFTLYNIDTLVNAEESWYLKYTIFFGQPTIAALINKCIDIMGSDVYSDKKSEISSILASYNSPYPEVNAMVRAIVIKWLEPKNKDHKPPPEEKGKVKQKVQGRVVWVDPDQVPDEPDPEMVPFITAWIQTYWELAIQSGIIGYGAVLYNKLSNRDIKDMLRKAGLSVTGKRGLLLERLGNIPGVGGSPKVEVVYSTKDQSKLGWYTPTTNSITINTYTWEDSERKEIVRVLKEKNLDSIETKLNKNKVWDKIFGYRFPAATLPHEMEHARRHQAHDSGHDSIQTSLFPGDKPTTRTFDQAANVVFQQVLGRGFYERFLERLNIS